jgi:uncharacterized membrane protein YdjX (TVP38/TMEM64 family)
MRWLPVALLLLAFVLVPFALMGEEQAEAWMKQAQGPAGAWILGGLLALDIVLPVPSSVVSTAAGALLGAPAGALVSTAGMTLAALAGYAIGLTGAGRARRFTGDASLTRAQDMLAKYGDLAFAACRPVPVLAEAGAIFAGLTRFPFLRFLLWTTLANAATSTVYAIAGAWSTGANAFFLAFAAALGLPALALLLTRRKRGTM